MKKRCVWIFRVVAIGAFLSLGLACEQEGQEGQPPPEAPAEPAETTLDEIGREAEETFRTAREYAFEKKDEFVHLAEQELAELEAKVADLEAKVEAKAEEAREEWPSVKQELMARFEAAKEALAELKAAGAEAWKEAVALVQAALEELEEAYEEARARFDSPSGNNAAAG